MDIYEIKLPREELEQLMPVLRECAEPMLLRNWDTFEERIWSAYDEKWQYVLQDGQVDVAHALGMAAGYGEKYKGGGCYGSPVAWDGNAFYESVKGQLREAICGKNGIYRKERRKIESSTEACITMLMPVVLSALHLPGAMAGAAVVIVLMISKIGVRAFCESTAPADEQKFTASKP